ncbi:MAG: quinone-dependent dihydroorotate dehydrogenase, partial [Saprospiraceae bacterium]|nr:quinone-dependent dihydroorotate dehydrogenase [Saprospiraceae bacterium]
MLYQNLIKPILFLFPAEKAHHISTSLFKLINRIPLVSSINKSIFRYEHADLKKSVFGIDFPNPIGLAAGFDKDGQYYKSMASLGFGFVEIGTVTPVAQDGNPQPRLFRLPEDKALINRMGFNNQGVDAMVERLKRRPKGLIVGGNIGKNKITPNENAINDYDICFNKLYPYVDYFVLNVSSPNTPNLRSLQDKEPLNALLQHVDQLRNLQAHYKPILLKIAPDLNNDQIDDVLDIVNRNNIDGIIATNTTISRADLNTPESKIENIGPGGLSGKPLFERSLEVVSYLRSKAPNLPIIGVGGISTPENALEMLKAGADLIQIYSGM